MPVPTANNSVVPMKVILKPNPKFGKSLSSITRQDRKTTLQISANAPADKFLIINEQIKGLFEQFEFPSGYNWDLGERAHRWDEEKGSSFVALQAALIGVLLIMGFFSSNSHSQVSPIKMFGLAHFFLSTSRIHPKVHFRFVTFALQM